MFELYLILSGVLSPADPGVLEDVANRRAVLFEQVPDWQDYEVLTAVEDCRLVGQAGWLITNGPQGGLPGADNVYTAIVIDCSQPEHSMNGIMADVNLDEVSTGWLILK